MNLLGEVESSSFDLDGFGGSTELVIPTQLVILPLAIVEGTSNIGVVACIYYMVFTMDFSNLFFASQSITHLFIFGS
jgi:hypothetical protein